MTKEEKEAHALYTVANAALLAFFQMRDNKQSEAFETLEDAYIYASHHLKDVFPILLDYDDSMQ